jgi:hypothetical protein
MYLQKIKDGIKFNCYRKMGVYCRLHGRQVAATAKERESK